MSVIVALFLIGAVLLFFEVITPGGVLGAIGGVVMLAGCGHAWHLYGGQGALIAFMVALALVGVTFWVELVLLPKTRLGKRMFLDAAISSTSQPPPAEAARVVGKTAEALTMLAPTGYVTVDWKRYEAHCIDGLAPKGAVLRVTGLDNFTLKVTKV
jgi:membrane-bound ClpP family serine protease